MNRCKELPLTTDLRIHEIAEAAGYQPPYFNRMFKKLEGITPDNTVSRASANKSACHPDQQPPYKRRPLKKGCPLVVFHDLWDSPFYVL